MARISGIDGEVKFGTTVGGAAVVKGLKEWSIDMESSAPEVTGFDSSGWRQYVAGLKGWSGSCTASWDTATDGSDDITALFGAAAASISCQLTTGSVISGDIVIRSMGIRDSVDGAPELTIQFAGSGTPTYPGSA